MFSQGKEPGDGTGESDGETESADAPNLEYARKQSNLVLQKLKDQLDRGEVDQKQLDDLGWTKEDMKRFVDRLEKQVNDTDNDTSPDAMARRLQFEEDLKGLKLNRRAAPKTGDDASQRRTRQVREARQSPVPAEFREQYEAYTKSLSQQGTAKRAAGKATPAKTAPANGK